MIPSFRLIARRQDPAQIEELTRKELARFEICTQTPGESGLEMTPLDKGIFLNCQPCFDTVPLNPGDIIVLIPRISRG